MSWQKELRVKTNQPLKAKTTLKIGGPAEFFSEPKGLAELKLLINKAKENNLPVSVIGAGSNLLISGRGVKGLLIKLNSPYFKKISLKDNYIEAGSGAMLLKLIQFAKRRPLSGIEFLAGIPGTLGGALAMNAGCWGKNIGDLVKEVKVMDYKGSVRKLTKREIKFSYRKSGLGNYIILSAVLKLKKESAKVINRNIKDYILKRRNSQDLTFPNAGCIFKNPASLSRGAGELIELCGLKGRRIGGASISIKHANFILNKGNANAEDVLRLMRLVRERVKKKFKVTLEPEIKIWQ
ncbi:MAG: UDP-N-acetylenolpyruvoylglucosamine reductase [Candidatus Omnitrophica bacterium CG23_combo_of_CG06-09_8_20_14_all_41_10]|uniref:UDP-N-acetylenolpyruvoylglucosamine reductase n=1 Tax=Candidatus Sherwoodlollariibacterium unditelluris TaxID=1974757 RepID=A0A2G9YHQ9_9BACT|nr:MAG: UDP-N-acetylenolpyruvoylglucosamine reductase [Candidatus Omnitrophica bacterium CG23_combo_of_CG06-09_8_20_14_all_41_10]